MLVRGARVKKRAVLVGDEIVRVITDGAGEVRTILKVLHVAQKYAVLSYRGHRVVLDKFTLVPAPGTACAGVSYEHWCPRVTRVNLLRAQTRAHASWGLMRLGAWLDEQEPSELGTDLLRWLYRRR